MKDFKELLVESCTKHANKPAFLRTTKSRTQEIVTYFQFLYEVKSLIQVLKRLEYSNDKIGIISENRYEWCVTFLAACICGKKVYPLDFHKQEKELEQEILESKIETLFFSSSVKEKIVTLFHKKKSNLRYLIGFDEDKSDAKIIAYEQFLAKGRYFQNYHTEEEKRVYAGMPSVILSTSGTKGKTKRVMLSQENICSNLMGLQKRAAISSKDLFLSILPLYHAYEFTMGFLWPISKGATIVFSKGHSHFYEELKEYKPTVLLTVPSLCENIEEKMITVAKQKKIAHQRKEMQELLGGKIRLLFCGAATLDRQVSYYFQKVGVPIYQVYGMTETAPVISMEGPYLAKTGSIGKVLAGGKIKIENPNAQGIGEICYKGPNVMLGYENEENLTEKRVQENWIYTEDLGYLDKKGYLYFVGRKYNRIVLKNGETVYPEEIEEKLKKIKPIKEVVVYEKQAKLAAQIVLKEKYLEEKDIHNKVQQEIDKMNEKMVPYKRVQKIEWREKAFPKTGVQKIKREIEEKEA